jgi:hypothetical protein
MDIKNIVMYLQVVVFILLIIALSTDIYGKVNKKPCGCEDSDLPD